MKEGEWPAYYPDQLTIGNPRSNVGLCTLWTMTETVLKKSVSTSNFAVAGQCYSRGEGISWIARNLLANKRLDTLVIYGLDKDHSGEALSAFFNNGVDSDHYVIGVDKVRLHREIPIESLNRLRQNVHLMDARKVNKNELDGYLSRLQSSKSTWGENEQYEVIPPTSPETLPSEETGMVIRGNHVGDVWLEVLDRIMTYGQVKESQYTDDQRELAGLTTIITNEDPANIKWKDFFQFTREHLDEYLPQLMSASPPEGTSYTYGSRLRDHDGVDQVAEMIADLKKTPFSRRAVGVTWNVAKDHDNPRSPCLDLIQGLVQGNRLHFTSYIRSNDMFKAWPENVIALRNVQYEIANAISQEPGDLITISNSAHIYSSDWNNALEIVEQNPIRKTYADPRGNFLIDLHDDSIKVSHLAPNGDPISIEQYKSAAKAMRNISHKVSDTGHAMYLGYELSRAETALKTHQPYIQDQK